MKFSDYEKKFDEIYETKIKPKTFTLEQERLKKLKIYNTSLFMIKVLFCLLFPYAFLFLPMSEYLELKNNTVFVYILFGLGFGIAAFLLIVCAINNSLRKQAKKFLLRHILYIFGEFYTTKKEVIPLKEINSLGLFNASKKVNDDTIVGNYNGLFTILQETELQRAVQRYNNNNQSELEITTLFKGLIIKVQMQKEFTSPIIIKEQSTIFDNLTITNGNIGINLNNLFTNMLNNKTIELEDPEFNEIYSVYSDDPVYARYILNPSFIENIKKLQKLFHAAAFKFVFKDKYLYIFADNFRTEETIKFYNEHINQHGLFEVSDCNVSFKNKDIYYKVFKEMAEILALINYIRGNIK